MTEDEHMNVSELQCNQEEADTRTELHALHANHGAMKCNITVYILFSCLTENQHII